MANRAHLTSHTRGQLNGKDEAVKIDFTRSSNVWCLYVAIMLLAALFFLNPIALSLVVHMSITRTIYMLFFDAMVVAIVVFLLRHLHRGQRRDLVLAIGLVALLPVALILIEPAIIAAQKAYQRTTGDQEAAIHRPDPLLGWQPVPDVHARHVSDGNFDVTYVIDAHGNKQIPTNPRAPFTVHFFGDSIVFGHGVSNDRTALNLLAGTLGDRANVVNHGVMAYGLEQMFLRLRENQDQIAPGDVVIFAPIAGDIERNLIGRRFVCWIYGNNYSEATTFPLLDDGAWRAEPISDHCPYPEGDLPIALAQRLLISFQNPDLDPQLAANADAVFDLARTVAGARGASFFVLFLVTTDECEVGAFVFDLHLLETPYTSLMPSCPMNPSALRFATDHHFNVEGQQWMAAALLEFLEQNVLTDRRQPSAPSR